MSKAGTINPWLVSDLLPRAAARWPHKTFLVSNGRSLTFGAVCDLAHRLAQFFQRQGVQRGDRVAIMSVNSADLVVGFFAALAAGAVYMPINPQTKASRLAFLLSDAQPAAFLAEGRLRSVWGEVVAKHPLRVILRCGTEDTDPASELPAMGKPDSTTVAQAIAESCPLPSGPPLVDLDLAALLYTSGSTGDPKGVMLSHRNVLSAINSVWAYLGLTSDDVICCALPLSFGYGLTQILLAACSGSSVVMESSFAFPLALLDLLERERITVLPGVPTMFAQLLAAPGLAQRNLDGIRILTNAAAALPEPHLQRLRQVFRKSQLFSMHGLTECLRTTYLPPEELDRRPTSVGKGMANVELYLVDENGHRLPAGSTGELVVRGSNVMRGYWRNPAETAKRLKMGEQEGERVLHTGDLFRTDEEGFFYFVARTDDVIKVRGEKVSPKEIETVLLSLPGLAEATVLGVPDPIDGQAIKAIVVLAAGSTLSERDIRRHCAQHLERLKVPQQIVFADSLPRTASGKIDKMQLRQAS